jgi:ribosome biogenesis GTPase A
MASATKKLKEIKPLDLIVEIIDARAIKTSKNEALLKEFNKPKMTIALKSDLSDYKTIKAPKDVIVGSIKDLSFKEKIIEQLYIFFQPKIDSLMKKGLLVPQFYIMVVGLPNVGKSSIINFLGARGAKAIVQNRPGVTRKNQMIKLNDNFFIYDTPGIMVKKITSVTQGYILALLNLIKREVLPIKEVSE